MQTKFAAKRVGNLNKFFTKVSVGGVLASLLNPSGEPQSVVDLGAGEGSLSAAVVSRWPKIEVVTADIDETTRLALHSNLKNVGCTQHTHYVRDVLAAALPNELVDQHGPFDIAVCNPPFFKPEWVRSHADILQNGMLADACRSTKDATAEILFISQCLSLLNYDGQLAVIVPDSLVTTSRFRSFRRSLLANHQLEKVVQLPLNSFQETDALCFILLIRKGGSSTKNIHLMNVESDKTLTSPICIDPDEAEARMDYHFHSLRGAKNASHTSLRELGAEILRGSLNTVERKKSDFPVFHTSDYKTVSNGQIILPNDFSFEASRRVIAQSGDILLARVDRHLHEKIGFVVSGNAAITDCVYRIRISARSRNAAYNALCSDLGRRNLLSLTKGVGARIIGKGDLLDMPLEVD